MDELLKILREQNADVNFENEKHLVDDGILNSLNIVMLVVEISSHFNIEISPEWVTNENFNSIQAMWNMVQEIQSKKQ